MQWTLEGNVFHAQQGDATTQVDFVETTYDENQPQYALTIPTGVTVIPLSLRLVFEDQAGTDTLVAWSCTTNDIGTGASTDAPPVSMRVNATAPASRCTSSSLYTGDATAATGLFEFFRWVDPFVLTAASASHPHIIEWSAQTQVAPVLVGPATLQMHTVATGNGAEGFGNYVWAEFTTPDIVTTVG
jgi:hypothetical protein